MKLLALVLLLSVFSSQTLTEVVKDFVKSKCAEFFIKSSKKDIITPTIFTGKDYKQICQYWKGAHRYATLYDTKNRIPVFSAYTFIGDVQTIRIVEWKNEPQLEKSSDTADMKLIEGAEMDVYSHQAVNRDYEESRKHTIPPIEYTRGHVFPYQYAAKQDQADSTFAFTNVAPQTHHSNEQWAKQVETPMRREILGVCRPDNENPTYVVTGVVPGKRWISITRKQSTEGIIDEIDSGIKIEEGVNIPSYYWTAFCCVDNNKVRISKAYLSLQNEPDDKTYELTVMSVNILNGHLTKFYNKEFIVFGGLCVT